MSGTEFPVSGVECPVSGAELSISGAAFSVSDSYFPVSGADSSASSADVPCSPAELEQPRVLLVDVVAEGGRAWVKAVGRKADSLLAAWAGRCPHGVRCVSEQAHLFLRAAQHNPLHFHAPRVVFSFYGGVPSPVACR